MSPAVNTGVMVAAVEVKIDGAPVDNQRIQEVRVQDSLVLPAAFSIVFTPRDLGKGEEPLAVEGVDVKFGAVVEISLLPPHEQERQKLFSGEITALEPDFAPDGVRLVASGYDRSHRLHRGRRTRTFQKQKASDIVQTIAKEAGLTVAADVTGPALEFVQQNNETNWEFLQRLASMNDREVTVDGGKLYFRAAGKENGTPIDIEFGPKNPRAFPALRLLSFHPRVSAAQQADKVLVRGWDPKTKKEITAEQSVDGVEWKASEIGITRKDAAVTAFGESTITVADAQVATVAEAKVVAQSLASYVAQGFVGAYGVSEGHPKIRAGTSLKIGGLGAKFSGTYRCSATTHVYGGGSGYQTRFEVLGRAPRELLHLASTTKKSSWGESLVVGIVTNNKDDEGKQGRVRVKYPALDAETEGNWARVLGIGAGPERGQMMLPRVGDEVLVGFEAGDPHKPYVLGALWNGKDKPGNELTGTESPDGSYVLRNDKKIDVGAKDNITIKTDKDLTIDVKGATKETVGKDRSLEVQGKEEVKVSQSFTLDAKTELVLKCGAAQIKLSSSGVEIKGTMVKVEGTGPVTIKGATVAIN